MLAQEEPGIAREKCELDPPRVLIERRRSTYNVRDCLDGPYYPAGLQNQMGDGPPAIRFRIHGSAHNDTRCNQADATL